MNVEEVLRRARELPQEQSNCIGTALYLVGLVDRDACKDTYGAVTLIEGLNALRIDEPRKLCLAAFECDYENDSISHLAVITSVDQLRLTHRNGVQRPIIYNKCYPDLLDSSKQFEGQYQQPPIFLHIQSYNTILL